jgi:hypothetical protein
LQSKWGKLHFPSWEQKSKQMFSFIFLSRGGQQLR